MNEPLMSTPTNMTRRGASSGAGCAVFAAGFAASLPAPGTASQPAAASASAPTAEATTSERSARMSGCLLLEVGIQQLAGERAGVLEVGDTLERQLQQVPVRRQEREEVERRRHQLHGRHEERVQQSLSLLAHPLELVPELREEVVGEDPELDRCGARGVGVRHALARDDGQD